MRRQGSADEIRIGVNGSSSSDKYFKQYLRECEGVAQLERELTSSGSCSLEDMLGGVAPGPGLGAGEDSALLETRGTEECPLDNHLVPLCWEDQLKKAEVSA